MNNIEEIFNEAINCNKFAVRLNYEKTIDDFYRSRKPRVIILLGIKYFIQGILFRNKQVKKPKDISIDFLNMIIKESIRITCRIDNKDSQWQINYMSDTYNKKNKDYGNSFEKSLDKVGIVAAYVRMNDKINRFYQLDISNEQHVLDESITDTLRDLATYAAMTIMWLQKK